MARPLIAQALLLALCVACAAAQGGVPDPQRFQQAARFRQAGSIPQEIVDLYNPAKNPRGPGVGDARGPALVPATRSFSTDDYATALKYSFLFYDAQRSGVLPQPFKIPWRYTSLEQDRVPGGSYDAGDTLKISLTIAQASMFLAWATLDFPQGIIAAKQNAIVRNHVANMADYLMRCRLSANKFVGMIGDPRVDHDYWGRPSQEQQWLNKNGFKRTVYAWTRKDPAMAASDLLGMTSAALSSASLLLRKTTNATYANSLLSASKQLYNWATETKGLYCNSNPAIKERDVYCSNRWEDKVFLAAAWLYRATNDDAYNQQAYSHFQQAGGMAGISPYVSWGDQSAVAVAVMLGIAKERGSTSVKGYGQYRQFMDETFIGSYRTATGDWGIRRTQGGMRYFEWSTGANGWGNLRYACNAAFVALIRANQLGANQVRKNAIAFARLQVDYSLGRNGRSFVVGFGVTPPRRAHHAAASCPNMPAPCGWEQFSATTPNPQVIRGALVGGPAGPGDNTYVDSRQDYRTNEVSLDYNAGFTGALAGLLHLGIV